MTKKSASKSTKAVKKAVKNVKKKASKVAAGVVAATAGMLGRVAAPTGRIGAFPYKVLAKGVKKLTRAESTNYVSLPRTPFERPVDNDWVVIYKDFMQRKVFNFDAVIMVTIVYNGVEYRGNTQHTCLARMQLDDSQCPEVFYVKFQAETEEAMREIYNTYDVGRARSSGDQSVALSFEMPETKGISKQHLKMFITAYKAQLFTKFENFPKGTHAEICCLVREQPLASTLRLVAAALRLIRSAEPGNVVYVKGMMRTTAVISAMVSTFLNSPKKAQRFWEDMAQMNTAGIGSPIQYLTTYLDKVYGRRNKNSKDDRVHAPQPEIYAACVLSFNAYCANVKIDHTLLDNYRETGEWPKVKK